MDGYLAARMIRGPLCLYDIDIAVDGGDTFIITTADRAADLPLPPVMVRRRPRHRRQERADQVAEPAPARPAGDGESARGQERLSIDASTSCWPRRGLGHRPGLVENLGFCGRARPGRSSRTTGWPTTTRSGHDQGRGAAQPRTAARCPRAAPRAAATCARRFPAAGPGGGPPGTDAERLVAISARCDQGATSTPRASRSGAARPGPAWRLYRSTSVRRLGGRHPL